jgi:hypothetical protein
LFLHCNAPATNTFSMDQRPQVVVRRKSRKVFVPMNDNGASLNVPTSDNTFPSLKNEDQESNDHSIRDYKQSHISNDAEVNKTSISSDNDRRVTLNRSKTKVMFDLPSPPRDPVVDMLNTANVDDVKSVTKSPRKVSGGAKHSKPLNSSPSSPTLSNGAYATYNRILLSQIVVIISILLIIACDNWFAELYVFLSAPSVILANSSLPTGRFYSPYLFNTQISSPTHGQLTPFTRLEWEIDGMLMKSGGYTREVYLSVKINGNEITFPDGNTVNITLSGKVWCVCRSPPRLSILSPPLSDYPYYHPLSPFPSLTAHRLDASPV